jgi:hypothetical protein
MEHGESDSIGNCGSLHHLQNQGHGPLAAGRLLKPAIPANHHPGQMGQ